jgi:hypothetical protein
MNSWQDCWPEFSRNDHLKGTCWDQPLWVNELTGEVDCHTQEDWERALNFCELNRSEAQTWPDSDKGKLGAIERMDQQIAFIRQRISELEDPSE